MKKECWYKQNNYGNWLYAVTGTNTDLIGFRGNGNEVEIFTYQRFKGKMPKPKGYRSVDYDLLNSILGKLNIQLEEIGRVCS